MEQHDGRAKKWSDCDSTIDAIGNRFESQWQPHHTLNNIDDYLPPDHAARLPVLIDLASRDLDLRLQHGQLARAEEYFRHYPELQQNREAAFELLKTEYEQRRCREQDLAADEYVKRFPEYGGELAARLSGLPVIRGYEVLAELGRGGMGIVYKARQASLNRLVALKLLRSADLAGVEELARFRGEAELLAIMRHPNIVQVYDVGNHRGRPFFIQEYVDGGSLSRSLGGIPQPAHQAAGLVETLARTIDAVHQRGIIHRDLKPANVLLSLDGTPKITDFGLAKRLGADWDRTRSGAVVGTPSYMAPEQAAGKSKDKKIGPAADVYALGAILYEMLTGRPPFLGVDPVDTLLEVMQAEPVPPRRLQPKVPKDLETICLKCLEKDPAKRYTGAQEIAEDLRRFRAGEAILARPAGPMKRLWRWSRRHPAGAVAASMALPLVILAAAWLATNERRHSAELVRKTEQETAQLKQRALEDRKRSLQRQIQEIRLTAHSDGWSKRAMDLVREALALGKDEQWRDRATAILVGIDAVREHDFKKDSSGVAISRTGNRVLMAGFKDFVNGKRVTTPARLWDSDTGKEIVSEKSGNGPVAFDDRDNPLQLVEQPGLSLVLWNVATQRQVGAYQVHLPPSEGRPQDWKFSELALSARGDYVAAVINREFATKGRLIVWECATGKVTLQQATSATALAFGRKGPWLAVASVDETTIWHLPTGEKIKSLKTGRGSINCLAFGRNPGRVQATGCEAELLATTASGVITIWDIARAVPISFCRGSNYEVNALAFSDDGATLASAGRATGKLWDVATGRPLLDLGVRNMMSGIALSLDGRRLVVSSGLAFFYPGGVDVWELDWGRGLQSLRGLAGQVAQVRYSADGKRIAALAHNWQVAIWEAASGRLEYLLDVPQGLFADNAGFGFSPDGMQFAFAAGREAKMWDLATGKEVRRWPLLLGLGDQLGFHGADKLLLFRRETKDGKQYPDSDAPAAAYPRVCRIRDLLSSTWTEPIKEITDFNWDVFRATGPADASYFVVQGMGGPEKRPFTTAYEGPTGKVLWSKPCSPDFHGDVSSGWFDPAGKVMTLVSELNPGVASLVQMPSGKTFVPPALAKGIVLALAPSAKFWSGTIPGRLDGFRLFRRDDKAPVVILGLDKTTSPVHAEFNSAGTHVAWGNDDGSVTVCDIEEVRRRLGDLGMGW